MYFSANHRFQSHFLLVSISRGGGGGGGTLIFLYIRRLGPFFGCQIFEFQYFLGFSKKNEYFFEYESFVDIFGGSSQNWTSFRGYFYVF